MRFFKHILLALAFAFPAIADTNVNTKTLQESLDSIDNWLGALAAGSGGGLPGTNIVGAYYDNTSEQWKGLMPGTNIVGATFSENNWTIDFGYLNSEIGGLRNEIYSVLRDLNLVGYLAYTYVPGTYVTNWQVYIVPTNAPHNSVIEARLWGSGGTGFNNGGSSGGFARGDFTVLTNGFNSTNPNHVFPGMELYVQVGTTFGRSAIWRKPGQAGVTNFISMTDELLVAGGGANSRGGGIGGGQGGGTNGVDGFNNVNANGGTQTARGAFGGGTWNHFTSSGSSSMTVAEGTVSYSSTNGGAGLRVWGAPFGYRFEATPGEGQPAGYYPANGNGGDGYYGGGAGKWSTWSNAGRGGGGSGFFATGISNAILIVGNSNGTVAGTDHVSYGTSFAGEASTLSLGNPGRVSFTRSLVP
jgi:hypothetical protein